MYGGGGEKADLKMLQTCERTRWNENYRLYRWVKGLGRIGGERWGATNRKNAGAFLFIRCIRSER